MTYITHFAMEVKNAVAGTLESGDIMIQIAPAETKGLHIDLDSTVAAQLPVSVLRMLMSRRWTRVPAIARSVLG